MPFSTWRELEGPKTPGGNHVIEVTDYGTGMDNETVKKIFEPFFTTKKYGMGTGIGLYVSKKQIERIGGGIEVKSKSGQGTVFKVVLPDYQDPGKLRTGTRDQ